MLHTHKPPSKVNMSFRFIFFTFLTFFYFSGANAQRNEIGFMFGGTYYMGDLNPTRPFVMPRIGGGALYRFNINNHLALRANFLYGSVEADDAVVKYNEIRNLHFRSTITEFSAQGEVNFLPFEPGDLETPYSPYLFGGGGVFLFNPRAQLDGTWHDLKPLATEGQGSDLYPERNPYSLISYNFLFGVGLKFNITRQITGGFEWGMRRTGTDYLDDVSTAYPNPSVFGSNDLAFQLHDRSLENQGNNADFQRGNPNVNDWYSFAGFILTFRIKNFSRGKCPAYN